TIVDDTKIDGAQTATITAHVANWSDGAATISVADNESHSLALAVPASASEGDGSKTGTVSIAAALASDLVVSLSSNDTTEVTVPAIVTILAGQTSASFVLNIVDDTILDGPQSVTITASASQFASGTGVITVA